MDKKVFFELIDRYLAGKASTAERALLEAYYERLDKMPVAEISGEEMEIVKEKMFGRIMEEMNKPESKLTIIRRINPWRRIAVAASIILLVGLGWYYIENGPKKPQPKELARTHEPAHDVQAPTSNKAIITLDNGKVIYLDSVKNGTFALQGNVNLQKLADGQISYTVLRHSLTNTQRDKDKSEIGYNTLTNPRGSGVIDMTLSDGSKVWLNAGSSMKFPVAFIGKERKVTVTGEAYFEVAHNTAMPFKVEKGDVEVVVLGTHFNVNAYDEDEDIRVTLLEGSVKVINSQWSMVDGKKELRGDEKVIKPGEQVILRQAQDDKDASPMLKITKGVDVDAVMAWKNGVFDFNNENISSIMKQLSRWYDTDISYEGEITKDLFTGIIKRNNNVSQVLNMLEKTNRIHFKIEGKNITVRK